MYNFHNPQLSYMTIEEEEFAKRFAPFINEANILEFADMAELAGETYFPSDEEMEEMAEYFGEN